MNSEQYLYAARQYEALVELAANHVGPRIPADLEATMLAASHEQERALASMIATPASGLPEITARARILAELADDGLFDEMIPGLARRIADDLARTA